MKRPSSGSVTGPLADLAKVLRELLRIPAALALRASESIGRVVLRALAFAWPLIQRALAGLRWLLHLAEREVTPVRALVVVNVLVLLALGASQLADYRSVSVGVEAYSAAGVDSVAPAPEIARESSTAVHGPLVWILVVVGIGLTFLAATRARALALGLVLVGAAAIVIGLAVDRPAGLDPGTASSAYEGVRAVLLDGFYAQLAAGLALIVTGPLLAAALSERAAPASSRPRPAGGRPPRRRLRARAGGSSA